MFTLKFRIVLTVFTLRITTAGQGYSEILSPISWASKWGEKIKKPHPKSSWSLFLGERLTPQRHCAIFLDGLEVHPSIWGMWKGERDPGTGPCQSHPSLIQQGWNSSFPDANAKVFNACIKNRDQCGKESSDLMLRFTCASPTFPLWRRRDTSLLPSSQNAVLLKQREGSLTHSRACSRSWSRRLSSPEWGGNADSLCAVCPSPASPGR